MNTNDKDQRELDSLRSFLDAQGDVKILLDNSASWADSQAEQSEKSRRTAWRVTAGACVFAGLSLVVTLTTIVLSHRPAPPPQVLLADRSTGAVERLVSLSDFQETASEATIKRAIATFIRAREGYTYDTAEQNYNDAGAFMSPQLMAQWAAFWDDNNPRSPLNLYKKDTKVKVDLGAISINRDANGRPTNARVSFTRTIKQNDIPVGGDTSWIATLSFNFVNAPTQERARRVNDLGFQVTEYQIDPDLAAGTLPTALAAPVRPSPVPTTPSVTPALQAPQTGANGVIR